MGYDLSYTLCTQMGQVTVEKKRTDDTTLIVREAFARIH